MARLIAVLFLVAGIVYFLWATQFLADTGEGALVAGSWGLVPGILGALGALGGSPSVIRAIAYGLLAGLLGLLAMYIFMTQLWPRL